MANEPLPSKQEQAYRAIRRRILDGAYGPGYRLIIDALAREFGTSPIPVREAVRRLEAEGLVQYQPYSGARVAPADETAHHEVFSTLAVLEGYATAQAAAVLGAEDLAELRRVNAEMRQALQDLDAIHYSGLNHSFHQRIHAKCPNTHVQELLASLTRQLEGMRRTVFAFVPGRSRASVAEHEGMIALLEQHAPEAQIEAFARDHKLRTLQAFEAWEQEHRASGQGAGAGLEQAVKIPKGAGQ